MDFRTPNHDILAQVMQELYDKGIADNPSYNRGGVEEEDVELMMWAVESVGLTEEEFMGLPNS